jgi:hypothetical protein
MLLELFENMPELSTYLEKSHTRVSFTLVSMPTQKHSDVNIHAQFKSSYNM